MTKHPDSTLWNLFSAVMACLTLVIGCTGPTTELTATDTPTSAAATATPAMASATATAAPPTETPTPTPIPVTFEIINDAGNPAQNATYQQLLAARLQITETVAFAAYHVGDVASLILLAGAPRDKVTGATIQPLTRLLAAENELLPLGCPGLLALTAAGGGENILLAGLAGKELAISGLIPYTNGEHYAIIQKNDGSVVLKNYLDQDNPDAPEYLLEIDPDNPERLVTYIDNSPIYLPTDWQEPIALDKASDLFINPFEALKAEDVIGNNVEFAQLPEYIQLPNGWQVFEFEGTITNRNTMDIFSNGSVAFGPNGEVLVANNNIDWSQVTDPGIGYAMSLKTDEDGNLIADPFNDNSFTLIATFLGDPEEPALVWHPEGGEDGNGAWVEEEKEYATAAEALLALRKEKIFEMKLGTGPNAGTLTSYIDNSWKEYEAEIGFTAGPVRSPDHIEPGAIEQTIREFFLNKLEKNGWKVAAVDINTGEAREYKIADENGRLIVDIDIISAISEGSPRYVALPPNRDKVTQLPLPGYAQSNSTVGEEFSIWYLHATADQKAKIVVYFEEDSNLFDDNWTRGEEEIKIDTFCTPSIVAPIALLTMPPQEMINIVLSLSEKERRPSCSEFLVSHDIPELGRTLSKLTGTLEIWQMADSQ